FSYPDLTPRAHGALMLKPPPHPERLSVARLPPNTRHSALTSHAERLSMAPVTTWQRVYFAAVGLLALWVGMWGYFDPAHVDQAIPWLVPPLHARFLGAMYLSGATFMLGCILSRRWDEVRVVVPGIAIWTGMLLVVSLFYLDSFDFSRNQV